MNRPNEQRLLKMDKRVEAVNMDDWAQLQQLQNHFLQLNQAFFEGLNDRPVASHKKCLKEDEQHLNQPKILENGVGIDALIQHIHDDIFPGLSASRGGRYWGFVTGGATPVATFADWLVSSLDQNVSKGGDSIATDIERLALRALCEVFELPSHFTGTFTTGATAANFLAAICARQFAGHQQNINVAQDGLGHLSLEVFSATPHASMIKSLRLAGIGQKAVTYVSTIDGSEKMDVEALASALSRSQATSKCVIASAGTVTGTDFDDIMAIARLCQEYNAWLHVDAAFGLFERLVTEPPYQTQGIELADSITLDCHKWLNVPYDCGVYLTRHPRHLYDSCHVPAPYLIQDGEEPDFMSLGMENSRRFRGLPVYLSILAYGKAGIRAGVKNNIDLSQALAAWLDRCEHFELLHPCRLNVVVFRPLLPKEGECDQEKKLDDVCNAFLQKLNQDGRVFMTPGQWQGKTCIRAALSNWGTTQDDLTIAQQALMDTIEKMKIRGSGFAS